MVPSLNKKGNNNSLFPDPKKWYPLRYGEVLQVAHWSSVRKGAVFGIFMGLMVLMIHMIYAIGFSFASLLRDYAGNYQLNINDTIVVSDVYY